MQASTLFPTISASSLVVGCWLYGLACLACQSPARLNRLHASRNFSVVALFTLKTVKLNV